jgi:hypothetical protein
MGLLQKILLTPSWVLVLAVVLLAVSLVWVRHKVADFRISLIGGARAPVLADNLFSGTSALGPFDCSLALGPSLTRFIGSEHSYQAIP